MNLLFEAQYMPPIHLFALFVPHDALIVEMQETYQKRSFRNRAHLVGANGKLELSVPLRKGKTKFLARDVEISYDTPWVKNHLSAIKACYGKAPYFDFYYGDIEKVLNFRCKFLVDTNIQIFFNIIHILKFNMNVSSSYKFNKSPDPDILDLRSKITPKFISSMATILEVEPYQQVFIEKHGFRSDLSILDLIFCLGPEASIYLKNYPVKKLIQLLGDSKL